MPAVPGLPDKPPCAVPSCPMASVTTPLAEIPASGPLAVLYMNGHTIGAYPSMAAAVAALASYGGIASGDQFSIGYATGAVPVPSTVDYVAGPGPRVDAVGSAPFVFLGLDPLKFYFDQLAALATQIALDTNFNGNTVAVPPPQPGGTGFFNLNPQQALPAAMTNRDRERLNSDVAADLKRLDKIRVPAPFR